MMLQIARDLALGYSAKLYTFDARPNDFTNPLFMVTATIYSK